MFQYLVKRLLTQADPNATATGAISLKANANEVNFRLSAKGLSAGQTYHLALNDAVVQTVTANALGQVIIQGWPASAPAVLDLSALSLLDSSNAVVLGTTLPK